MGVGNISLLQALISVCVLFGISELLVRNSVTVSLQKPFTWKMTVSLTSTDFLADQEGQPVVSCCPPCKI